MTTRMRHDTVKRLCVTLGIIRIADKENEETSEEAAFCLWCMSQFFRSFQGLPQLLMGEKLQCQVWPSTSAFWIVA